MVTAVFAEQTGVDAARRPRRARATPTSPPGRSSRRSARCPAFADSPDTPRARADNPVSYDLAERAINLPSALTLTEDQVDRVCAVVKRLVER